MSDQVINNTVDFNNKYDNSDLQTEQKVRDISVAYNADAEVIALKHYLEVLKLENELDDSAKDVANQKEMSITYLDDKGDRKRVKVKRHTLIPTNMFNQRRRWVISKLTQLPESEIKKLYSEFETESLFELSSKIANHLNDKERRERVSDKFKFT